MLSLYKLYKLFKINLCFYNTIKVKQLLIINIQQKHTHKLGVKFLYFPKKLNHMRRITLFEAETDHLKSFYVDPLSLFK